MQEFAKVIFQLGLIFKGVGASRPYYTCEKIHESYRKIVAKKDSNPEKLVEVWALYPTLIEFSIQLLLFLDFEMMVLQSNRGKKFGCQTED